jgi:hypothetical protein
MPQKDIPPLKAISLESKQSVTATVDEASVTGADLTPRRDFVSKAIRVMEDKLKHVPVHILDAAVGKKQKLKVEDYIAKEFSRITASRPKSCVRGVYLSTKFWTEFNEEYEFDVSYIDELSDPELEDKTGTIDPALKQAIGLCHAPSFADKTTEVLEQHLAYCRRLGKVEFYGIADASVECLTLNKDLSMRMHVAFLRYISRNSQM